MLGLHSLAVLAHECAAYVRPSCCQDMFPLHDTQMPRHVMHRLACRVPDYMPKRSAQYASYIGGALVAKGLHAKHIFSKEDYDEKGPTHIHRVC